MNSFSCHQRLQLSSNLFEKGGILVPQGSTGKWLWPSMEVYFHWKVCAFCSQSLKELPLPSSSQSLPTISTRNSG